MTPRDALAKVVAPRKDKVEMRKHVLVFHYTGPLMIYEGGTLHIHDLNPEVKLAWRIKRMQMIGLAWRCLMCALCP